MRILKQMIEKKFELHQEFMLNRQYIRGIWEFYCCLNLSIAVLRLSSIEYSDELFIKRNIVWRKWLSNSGIFDNSKFKRMQRYMQEDMKIIIHALEIIDKINTDKQFEMSQFDPVGSSYVGCIGYEFPS